LLNAVCERQSGTRRGAVSRSPFGSPERNFGALSYSGVADRLLGGC
jgi:hypothetical protein